MIKEPSTPNGWAIQLTKVLKEIRKLQGVSFYPVNATEIAYEFSKTYFPNSYIRKIVGYSAANTFDGALLLIPNSGDWVIFYNAAIASKGRINFTIAHELGHFFLHRELSPLDGFQCSNEKIENWYLKNDIEKEANQFAASLLMPFDDFRAQIGTASLDLSVIDFLSDRYQVSRTAIMLRWVSSCAKRAKVVYSINGEINWIYPTKELARSTDYVNPKKLKIPVPQASLALVTSGISFSSHPPGVWSEEEEVDEVVFSYEKNSEIITVSLLIYPDDPPEKQEEDGDGLYTSPQCRIFEEG